MDPEGDLIARHFAPWASHPGALHLLDDAAVLEPEPGYDLVLTKDVLVADVHFFAEDPPASIARKALRVNLSDLAAKGAEPVGFLLGLALADDWTQDWLAAFAEGLRDDAARFGAPLLGGDTVRARGALTLSITAVGRVPAGRAVRRTGAVPGDLVYVTGTIGDAALGLALRLDRDLEGRARAGGVEVETLLDRYLHPRPRLEAVAALAAHASAAMDVSDGLVGDLGKLVRASGVGARVTAMRVPLSNPARALIELEPRLFEAALTGGDDYEILCTVPPAEAAAFERALAAPGLAVTKIGEIQLGEGALVLGSDEEPLSFARGSYSHF